MAAAKPTPGVPDRLSRTDLTEVWAGVPQHPGAEPPERPVSEGAASDVEELKAELLRLKQELAARPPGVESEEPTATVTAVFRAGRAKWWALLLAGTGAVAGAGAEAGTHAFRKDVVVTAVEDWQKAADAEKSERRAAIELLRSELVTRQAAIEARISDGEDWTASSLEQACDVEVTRELGARARSPVLVNRPISRRTLPKIQILTAQPAGSR